MNTGVADGARTQAAGELRGTKKPYFIGGHVYIHPVIPLKCARKCAQAIFLIAHI